jgi:urease subunit gamma/beta
MRLTAWEEERLLIFTAAELARRHRERGLLLNAPEVVALICDAMLEAARAGAAYAEVERAGRDAVTPEQALPGVAALVGEVRLEVLMDDGARLVVLLEPLGPAGDDAPGAVRQASLPPRPDQRDRIDLEVRNTSTRAVRVSSHYPFERANPRLEFDRAAATGYRLDLPAGSSERWAPGEARTVALVRFR